MVFKMNSTFVYSNQRPPCDDCDEVGAIWMGVMFFVLIIGVILICVFCPSKSRNTTLPMFFQRPP